jgi:hypothetical protein
MKIFSWTLGLAVFFIIASIFTLFIWIPNDIETGVIEIFRRRVTIGDAMAPTMVATGILIISVCLGIDAIVDGARSSNPIPEKVLDRESFIFLFKMTVVITLGLSLIFFTGPLCVELSNVLTGEADSYRYLKASFPYKYIGYLVGGFILVFGIISLIENRFSGSAAWITILTVLLLIILYDVPFNNLLLPPNADY